MGQLGPAGHGRRPDLQIGNLPCNLFQHILSYLLFRGLSLGSQSTYLQMDVLGGGMTISKGLLGETFQETGEDIYGITARTQPWERLTLEGDFFQTQN